MIIEVNAGGEVRASFPALQDCEGTAFDPDPWKARDKAILNCAKEIVARLQVE
jgi:hypothetical protein